MDSGGRRTNHADDVPRATQRHPQRNQILNQQQPERCNTAEVRVAEHLCITLPITRRGYILQNGLEAAKHTVFISTVLLGQRFEYRIHLRFHV